MRAPPLLVTDFSVLVAVFYSNVILPLNRIAESQQPVSMALAVACNCCRPLCTLYIFIFIHHKLVASKRSRKDNNLSKYKKGTTTSE